MGAGANLNNTIHHVHHRNISRVLSVAEKSDRTTYSANSQSIIMGQKTLCQEMRDRMMTSSIKLDTSRPSML